MGIFSKKKKPKDSNYINFNSALNAPYAVSHIENAMMKDLGEKRAITQTDLYRYCGVPRHLVEIEFQEGTLRLCNDPFGDITAGGKRFISDGTLTSFDDVEETAEINQRGITIKLNSMSETLISMLNAAQYIRVPVTGYHAYMDPTGTKDNPSEPFFVVEFFKGYVDQPEFTYNAIKDKAEFKITTTAILERLSNSNGQRTAHSLHILRKPGDNFFKYSSVTQTSKEKNWKML
ncbi:hypothetical protein [Aeromonas hydrophila]|uniref:hypothetical protein n=1 Tax=Aeromonas hydrophila TaxID=644 RepID=UPI003D1F329D